MRSRTGILPRLRSRSVAAGPPPASAVSSSSSMTLSCSSMSSRFWRNCAVEVSSVERYVGASDPSSMGRYY